MDIKTGEETAAVSRRRTHPRRGILPGLREGAFAVSPNARWLADWHVRGTMLIWDLRNKVPKLCVDFALSPSITVQEEVVAAAFSPHGSVLIGVSSRGRIWYWDIATGIPLRRPVHHSTSSEISYSAQCAFSRTGARFAWIHYKEPFHPDAMRRVPSRSNSDTDPHAEPRHLLKVLDLSDPGRKRFHPVVLRGHTGPILAFSFSQDGQYVATASADESVRLWQTSDGRCLRRFTEHRARVTHVVISDNGQLLVSGGEDGLIWVRNMEQILVFEGLLRTEV
ncbi:WD40-repeat-containing domain protein [Daedaleopsis nitida]|nr:WD40-repeat-containing domain protein [Daedaleopsis nitida]